MSIKQNYLAYLVACLLVLTSIPVMAQDGTTYYVSNAGDDANDGLSPDTAWQTIEYVNTVRLADNDTVLFRRGDTFRGEFRLYKTPVGVTVGAYGEDDADTYWLDNVTFEPVTALLNDAQFYSRLFMNPTDVTTTIDLQPVQYQDLSGNTVMDSIELGPYSAEILLYIKSDWSVSVYLPLLLKN